MGATGVSGQPRPHFPSLCLSSLSASTEYTHQSVQLGKCAPLPSAGFHSLLLSPFPGRSSPFLPLAPPFQIPPWSPAPSRTPSLPVLGLPSLKTVAWNKTSILPGNPEDMRMQVKQRFPVLWLSGNRSLSTPSFQLFPSADGYGELPAGTNGSRPTLENSVPWGGCSCPCGVRSSDAGFEGAPPEGRPKCPASSSEQVQPSLRSWGPPWGPGLSGGGPGGLRAVVAARGEGLPRSLRGRGGRERRGAGLKGRRRGAGRARRGGRRATRGPSPARGLEERGGAVGQGPAGRRGEKSAW